MQFTYSSFLLSSASTEIKMLIKMHFSALSILNELHLRVFNHQQPSRWQRKRQGALRNSYEQAFSIRIACSPSQNRSTETRPQLNRVKVWKQPQNHLSLEGGCLRIFTGTNLREEVRTECVCALWGVVMLLIRSYGDDGLIKCPGEGSYPHRTTLPSMFGGKQLVYNNLCLYSTK